MILSSRVEPGLARSARWDHQQTLGSSDGKVLVVVYRRERAQNHVRPSESWGCKQENLGTCTAGHLQE